MRYLILLLVLASCSTERRVTKQVGKIHVTHPQVLSRYCATEFPVIARVETDTMTDTVFAEPVVYSIDCDTMQGVVKVKCPPCKEVVRTVTNTVTKTNTAAIDSMQRYVKVVEAKYERAQAKVESRRWWIWGACITWGLLLLALVVYVIGKIKIPVK